MIPLPHFQVVMMTTTTTTKVSTRPDAVVLLASRHNRVNDADF